MKKRTKISILIASLLCVIGLIVGGISLASLNFDFEKLSTFKYTTTTHEIGEAFDNIFINTDEADITFVLSENETCKIVCRERKNIKHRVSVTNNTLFIKEGTKHWYDYIGFSFTKEKITIELPKSIFDSLHINGDTGDIKMPSDFSFKNVKIDTDTGDVIWRSAAENLEIEISTGDVRILDTRSKNIKIEADTGDVYLKNTVISEHLLVETDTGDIRIVDTQGKNINAEADTGDIYLKNTVISDRLVAEADTGDIKFDRFDAASMKVKTDTGDVTGTLLSDKIFIPRTSTGSISVPKTTTGGVCEIKTSTGDIKIKIAPQ